jgi:hypothetical protein
LIFACEIANGLLSFWDNSPFAFQEKRERRKVVARIMITLSRVEKDALLILSEKELRDPRAQAALIIREELQRQGLIPIHSKPQFEEHEDVAPDCDQFATGT